jgi:hypothetical protein
VSARTRGRASAISVMPVTVAPITRREKWVKNMCEKCDIENHRLEYSKIIHDEKTTQEDLVCLFEFFREHMYVVDNEIKKRFWVDFQMDKKK